MSDRHSGRGAASNGDGCEQALARLRESEQRLAYVSSATGEAIWDWDIAGDTVTHNARWCALLGLADDYLEHPVSFFVDRVHMDDRSAVDAAIRHAMNDDAPYLSKHRLRREDGSYLWVLDRGRVVERDAGGRPSRMVGSFADITETQALAEELHRYRDHLEEQVAQRTRELAAARDAAETANRAKSAFLANMSHAIRTPMNVIIGLTHLMRRDSADERERDRLGKVYQASHQLLEIVNEVLDLARIEAGRFVLDDVECDLNELLVSAGRLVVEQARAKGLELLLDPDPALTRPVRGDPIRLRRMVLNYASNAVKFSERGVIVLRSRLVESDDRQAHARIEVIDQGIGIVESDRERLFQPFEQIDASTSRRYTGTGLGLAINQRLAGMMGGDVGLDSRPGAGSTFWFSVRLPWHETSVLARPVVPEDLRGMRGLIVDDVSVSRDVLADQFWLLGMSMATASSGEEALALARAADVGGWPFDVALIDWRMPGMDGIETARRLRALGLSRQPELMLVTAHDHMVPREEARAAGIETVLAKPVVLDNLSTALRSLLRTRVAGSGPGSVPAPAAADPGAQLLAALSDVPGLDVEFGIKSLMGHPDKFARMLHRYIESHAGDVERMRDLCVRGEVDDARRLIHSLKGLSGTLGLTRIQALAAALEGGLKSGQADPGQARALEVALQALVPAIAVVPDPLAPVGTPAVTPARMVVLDELEALLAEDNMLANESLGRHRAEVLALMGQRGEEMASLIEGYRYEQALRCLRVWRGAS